ncbi:hypothetical protein PPROV_000842800 [Pycnococcus provasolii]|uniref:Uncharacterized protein n=1 Tax=Pycnococcus provasolii TaxID=41880 RepID=A0A830HSP3_9CHLO|nr:hypothetical protein PPROV_000842800 [Pycnococcus provasolii]|mmetsp:Transcript_10055/g.26943  ORF Transcript_10055/g.26943 Transcript_10055/m.26943 type:complete len:203 (-) Transcript_10055:1344-1952(-)
MSYPERLGREHAREDKVRIGYFGEELPEAKRHGYFRDSEWRCTLCDTGSMYIRGQCHQHELGDRHTANYETYRNAFVAEGSRMKRDSRIDEVAELQESPYWIGNLCNIKSLMLDYIVEDVDERLDVPDVECRMEVEWVKHKQRVRSDLLLAAIVRKTIISEHGSVESARETYTSNQSSWTEYLRTMASRGHALQALAMAYIV